MTARVLLVALRERQSENESPRGTITTLQAPECGLLARLSVGSLVTDFLEARVV